MKYRFVVLGVVVFSMLVGCTSGVTTAGNSSDLPIAQLLVKAEDFTTDVMKVDDSKISEFDSALDGVFPYECPGITQELLNYVDKKIVQFDVPANFSELTRNNDFYVIQEVFRFENAEDVEGVMDALQAALSSDCYFDGYFSEYVTQFKKLTLSDGPLVGFTWNVEQSQTPSATCGASKVVFRSTYWAHISGRDIYFTQAKGTECFGDPQNSYYSDTVNAALDAVKSLGN